MRKWFKDNKGKGECLFGVGGEVGGGVGVRVGLREGLGLGSVVLVRF